MASTPLFLCFLDAIDPKPADEVLDRQLLGQQLLVGGAPVLSRGAEPVHIGKHLVPLLQKVGVHAVVGRQRSASDIEAEIDHVAVLDDIVLALAAEQSLFPGGGHAAALDHVVIGDNLRPDEAPLDVRVDLAGGLTAGSATPQAWFRQVPEWFASPCYPRQSVWY